MSWLSKCCLVLLGAMPWAAGAAAAELTPSDGGIPHAMHVYGEGGGQPSEILLMEPDYASDKPLYMTLTLGNAKDRIITSVLDESAGTGGGYDTIYVDANNNGDLTDDGPIEVKHKAGRRSITFTIPSIPLTVKYHDGTQRKLAFEMSVEGHGGFGARDDMYWSVECQLTQHLQGELEIGEGRRVLIGIYDASRGEFQANGCFDDYGLDRLRIDLDGDNELAEDKEDFPLSKVIPFDGKFWELSTDSAAKQVAVKPCGLPLGTVKLALALAEGAGIVGSEVELSSHSGYAFRFEMSKEGSQEIPAGKYRVSGSSLDLRDADGTEWNVRVMLPRPLRVREAEEAPLVLGMPLKVVPTVAGRMAPGGELEVGHEFVGAGGEVYAAISRKGERQAPSVRIVDAEGIAVAEGKMEYG